MSQLHRVADRAGRGVAVAFMIGLPAVSSGQDVEANKALARRFYENVWFSNNPGVVDEIVAPEYVIHDVGGIDGLREPAGAQRDVADFFWQAGAMGGRIDFQVAEGDLVATRWQWEYTPSSWWMKALMAGGQTPIPVINVFRFQEGRIVEIWNHRHDIDIGFRVNVLLAKGFLAGVIAMLLVGWARRLWRARREPAVA
jgi:predicted ester cyclase